MVWSGNCSRLQGPPRNRRFYILEGSGKRIFIEVQMDYKSLNKVSKFENGDCVNGGRIFICHISKFLLSVTK